MAGGPQVDASPGEGRRGVSILLEITAGQHTPLSARLNHRQPTALIDEVNLAVTRHRRTVVLAAAWHPIALHQLAAACIQTGEETTVLDDVDQAIEIQRRGAERNLPRVFPDDVRAGDVASAAASDGQNDIPSLSEQSSETLVLFPRDRAVLVQIDLGKALSDWTAGQLLSFQLPIAVFVQPLDNGVERLRYDGCAGLAAGRPTGHVQSAIFADHRRHADGARDAAHCPHFLAGLQIVSGHAQSPRHNNLLAPVNVPDNRRAVAA